MTFYQFLELHGLLVERIYPRDTIQRCPTITHPKSTNGAFYFDGRRGWVWNWEGVHTVQWWNDDNAKPWTEEEKQAWRRRQQESAREKERKRHVAAQEAKKLIQSSIRQPHPYLEYKGLGKTPGLTYGEELIVPMMDNKDNAVLGAQRIFLKENSWEKKMLYGQRSKGAVLKLGSPKVRERILCEGYATGLSIGMAVSQLKIMMGVVVCFSAYNMIEVAKDTPGRVMVFADNDRSGAGQQAAEATGCPWIMADNEGFDANDLHKIHGLGEVRKKIIQLRNL